jgi:hypothetical protein
MNEKSPQKESAVDMAFIGKQEGASITRGYVPLADKSQSGVTIATGFDIGQQSNLDMLRADLRDRLAPYLHLKGADAKAFLQKHPLEISVADAKAIDDAYETQFIHTLMTKYDKATSLLFAKLPTERVIPFADLPAGVQTAVASVAFQYGDLATRTPIFWGQVTQRKWADAIATLEDFHDSYHDRRKAEAALMRADKPADDRSNS